MPRTTSLRPMVIAAFVLALAVPAVAVAKAPPKPAPNDAQIQNSQGFMSAHPDLRWRLSGLEAYRAQDFEKALEHFRRAARFADKPAQGMVAEMLWQGQGTAQDRPLAYAWMDLAAERMYPTMVLNRERYWAALNADERAAALAQGKAVFDEYADAVAKPRLETLLRRERKMATGSRTGAGTRSVTIIIPTPGGGRSIDASQYYNDKFWNAEQYWSWQDNDWRALPKGRVDIGPLQSVPADGETPTEPAEPQG